ncbi:MAG: hypothetical protein ABJM18_06935 [Hyphomonas sp.]|uniref:hypothetical protein n=1 Tax=Hyphomonas sp. TaxID=87 RepID=UPI0032990B11
MIRLRRGSLLLAILVALIPMTAYLAVSINSGQLINERREVQDAADSLAEMHGVWSARSLNTISMNNVEAAQLLTVAIGSEALDEALDRLHLQSYVASGIVYAHSPVCFGFRRWWRTAQCLYRHFVTYQRPARSARSFVSRTNSQYQPAHGITVSHQGLHAVDAANREIVARFARAVGEIARDYLEILQIDNAHFVDGCTGPSRCAAPALPQAMALPVTEGGGVARAEVCQGMRLGTLLSRSTFSQKGFTVGRGPLSSGGSAGRPAVKDHINQSTGTGSALEDFYRYYRDLRMMAPGPDRRFPRWGNFLLAQSATGANAFTRRFDAKEIHLCTGVALVYALRAPIPEFWRPIGQPDFGTGPRRAAEMPEAYRILALAQSERHTRVASDIFRDPDFGHYGYGQATVYNPDGLSLFSQNWRARPVPATRMDDPSAVARDLTTRAPVAFAQLAAILEQAGTGGSMEALNAH